MNEYHSDASSGARTAPIATRHVIAVCAGNALEFYDFVTYAFFAVYIGRAFFPMAGASGSLLLSLATFGAGFVTRPLGGLVIAPLGDRIGRKPAMILSFSLMGAAIVGLALTPSYASIGIAAPLSALFFRLLQGFAVGGEVGPTASFLIEAAPAHRRGFYGALLYATSDFSVLCAGLVGLALARTLDAQQLQDWGWRVALLIGAAIVPFGVYLRRSLPETLGASAASAETAPRKGFSRLQIRIAILGFILLGTGTVWTYTRNYMTTYAIATLGMDAGAAFGATVVAGLLSMVLEPLGGLLSDRFGRKPAMIVPAVLLVLAIFPAFRIMEHFRTPLALYGAVGGLVVLASFSTPPVLAALTESLPVNIRSGTLGIVYAFAIATFGGSTQFMLAWLIRATGNPLAPAWYLSVAVIGGVFAMALMRESAPRKIKHAIAQETG